jgi:hypothetical protein
VLEKNGERAFGHGAVADKQDFFIEFDHGAGRWQSGEQLGRHPRVLNRSACKLNHELCGKGRWLTSSFPARHKKITDGRIRRKPPAAISRSNN